MSTWRPAAADALSLTRWLRARAKSSSASTFFPAVLNVSLGANLRGQHNPSFVFHAQFSPLPPPRERGCCAGRRGRELSPARFRMARACRGSHPFLSRLPTAGERAATRQKLGPSAHGPRTSSSPEDAGPGATSTTGGDGAPASRSPRSPAGAWAAGCRAEEGAARPATHPRGPGPRHPTARPAGPHCPRRRVPPHTPPARASPGPTGRGRQTFSSARRRGRLSSLSASGRSSPGRAAGPSLSPTPGRRPGRAPIHSRRPRRSRTWPWLMVGPNSRALTWLERRRRPQGAGSARPG